MASLFVALDALSEDKGGTLRTAQSLIVNARQFGFKLNLDYLLENDLGVAISTIQKFDRPIFADLKMWNGDRTMTAILRMMIDHGVEFISVHALSDNLLAKAIEQVGHTKTYILGATILSHYDEEYCQKHFRRTLNDSVRHLAEVALEAGCHGIIVPGTALGVVRDLDVLKVVSGIRPRTFKDFRHQQEVTPRQAVDGGAEILVCGSPIMKSESPSLALNQILNEMKGEDEGEYPAFKSC